MIHFFNRNRNEILTISEVKIIDCETQCLNYIAQINYVPINFSKNIKDYLFNLENFKNDLIKLYENQTDSVNYISIEGDLRFYIERNHLGQINVELFFQHRGNDEDTEVDVTCKYGIDQSFLPELIGEINEVLTEIG